MTYLEVRDVTLLNPLLSFFGICVPRSAQSPLVSRNQLSNKFVFPYVADSLMVTFCSPWPWVQFRPVDLIVLAFGNSPVLSNTYIEHSILEDKI